MSSSDWRSSLTFSERLSTIVEMQVHHPFAIANNSIGIVNCLTFPVYFDGRSLMYTRDLRTTSYRTAFADSSPSEANQEAKVLEADVYQNASTRQDYDKRIEVLKAELMGDVQSQHVDDLRQHATGDITSPVGVNFGKYKEATHHNDGLFSTIYVGSLPEDSPEDWFPLAPLVALKVTVPQSMEEPPHNSRREVRILHHAKSSNVIPLLESFRHDGDRLVLVFPFMVYELTQLVDQPFSSVERKSWLRDIFSALEFLHSHNIIHRDVKPSNILLKSTTGPVFLADFGIAWLRGDPDSEPADEKITDVGTTCYRPPELLFGNTRYTTALDIWAAGCTAAEVLCSTKNTLFDAGDVGSELALIQSIFQKLGTPTTETWPEAATYPDWGKMEFYSYPAKPWSELMPDASEEAGDFVSKLICFESGERLSAHEALEHPLLKSDL